VNSYFKTLRSGFGNCRAECESVSESAGCPEKSSKSLENPVTFSCERKSVMHEIVEAKWHRLQSVFGLHEITD